jgi:hypothetical protein
VASRDLAAYVNWSSVVGPAGRLERPTMYMSKNWMTKTWSWDHCFNAIALTAAPTLALDQFLTLFDHQDAYGALPDCIDDATISFNFAKPPVHGWTWRKMTQRMAVDASQTLDVYRRLSRLTDWWLLHRTTDAGLPHYRHGNDSGWDNGTAFRRVVPVESPDLCAFLVIQMDVLADLADDLGLGRESIDWRTKADRLLTQMTTRLWVDGRFVARGVIDQEPIPSHSLLMYVSPGPRGATSRRHLPGTLGRPAGRRLPDPARVGHGECGQRGLHLRRVLARPDLGSLHVPHPRRPGRRRPPRRR